MDSLKKCDKIGKIIGKLSPDIKKFLNDFDSFRPWQNQPLNEKPEGIVKLNFMD